MNSTRLVFFRPLILAALLFTGCAQDDGSDRDPGPTSETHVAGPPVPLTIEDSQIVRPHKRALTIRLQRKTTPDTLWLIAQYLHTWGFDRTFITYLLPGMIDGAGAWATTHYDPDLEVKIFGSTSPQDSGMAADAASVSDAGTKLGEWLDDRPGINNRRVLFRNGNVVMMHTVFLDSSRSIDTLSVRRANGREIFVNASGNGEYYVISKAGTLDIYDADGIITSAKPGR
jgi:hypothetical protein